MDPKMLMFSVPLGFSQRQRWLNNIVVIVTYLCCLLADHGVSFCLNHHMLSFSGDCHYRYALHQKPNTDI